MKEMTASELTRWAKQTLELRGYRLNRVNNIPVRRRKGTIQKGWADIQGYTSGGTYVAIEVKKIGDSIKKEQKERLQDITLCGGIAYICTQDEEGNPILISFTKFE
jgi:hypothetical protein